MSWKYFIAHVLICVAIGAIVAALSDVNWVAAAFWCSAALVFNGSLAFFEDGQAGGFDNDSDAEPLADAKGTGALRFWASSIAICVALAAAGFVAQVYL